MGTYISQSDLTPAYVSSAELVDLTNDDPTASTVNTTRLNAVILEAEAEVDSYLAVRYELPLPATPAIVAALAARLTRYRLYANRPVGAEEFLEKDRQNAVALLKRIAEGKAGLGLTAGGADVGASRLSSTRVRVSGDATAAKPVFGRGSLDVY